MDRSQLLRLVAPLQEGSVLRCGATLQRLVVEQDDRDPRRDRMRLEFSTGLAVSVAARHEGAAAFRTRHHCLSIHSDGERLSDIDQRLTRELFPLLEANDRDAPAPPVPALVGPPEHHPDAPELWLLPGHLGNPLDLTVRTLRVLKTVHEVVVERGSADTVRDIYVRFDLGPAPTVTELDGDTDEASLRRLLASARDEGRTVALFGADEGLPGICDPGWKLMRAARSLEPPARIRSAATGSALTTALMYTDASDARFAFLGLMHRDGEDHSEFIRRVAQIVPVPGAAHQAMFCLAAGQQLCDDWPALHTATRHLHGTLDLYMNLSRDREAVHHLDLGTLPPTPPEFLQPSDKVVLRVAWEARQPASGWLRRLLWRLTADRG